MVKIDLTNFHNDYHAPEPSSQSKTYANSKMLFASLYLFYGTNRLLICLQWMLAAGRSCKGKGSSPICHIDNELEMQNLTDF